MITVDARGLSCPEPIMLTRAEMKKNKEETIEVLLDEVYAVKNVKKFVLSEKREVSIDELENNEWRLVIT